MVLYVWKFWISFVCMRFNANHQFMMNQKHLEKSRQFSNFWRPRGSSSLLKLIAHMFLQFLTLRELRKDALCIAGVMREGNCNQLNSYDIVAKKNTRISRPSVLDIVRRMLRHEQRILDDPSVTFCTKSINRFVRCYV